MNTIQIMGNLGADPEERHTPDGKKVITFRIADNQRKKGQDETIWWRGTLWGDHPLVQYMKKGSSVVLIGEVKKTEIFTNRDGQPQSSNELTVFEIRFSPFGKKDDNSNSSMGQSNAQSNDMSGGFSGFGGDTAAVGAGPSAETVSDDVPF